MPSKTSYARGVKEKWRTIPSFTVGWCPWNPLTLEVRQGKTKSYFSNLPHTPMASGIGVLHLPPAPWRVDIPFGGDESLTRGDKRNRCALGSPHSTISCPISWWGMSRWRRQKPPCPTWTGWRPLPLPQFSAGEAYRMIWNSFVFSHIAIWYVNPVPGQQQQEPRRIHCKRKQQWVYYSLTDYVV